MNNAIDSSHAKATSDGRVRPIDKVRAGLARRYARERRFRFFGWLAVVVSFVFVALLFASIVAIGHTAIWQTRIALEVNLDPQVIDPEGKGDPAALAGADYGGLLKGALASVFPEIVTRADRRALWELVSSGAPFELGNEVQAHPELVGKRHTIWVTANDPVDMMMKGHVERDAKGGAGQLQPKQVAWIDQLIQRGQIEKRFNSTFFTAGDSRGARWDLERHGGLVLYPLGDSPLVLPDRRCCCYLSGGVCAQESLTDLIEVNINNLAAVPSIVFGLLGLAVFINFLGMPRSAPLVGGIVLALMALPIIIVASRSALKAVPPSIREGALGVGASKAQTVFHHVVPLAMPGMLTGTIIGMAHALGETAPLLMIGMVAFIADIPRGITDSATGLPVQIFLWADSPERAFMERTAAAIMVLLVFMVLMNSVAIVLRKRFERRW